MKREQIKPVPKGWGSALWVAAYHDIEFRGRHEASWPLWLKKNAELLKGYGMCFPMERDEDPVHYIHRQIAERGWVAEVHGDRLVITDPKWWDPGVQPSLF